ncbi:Lipase 2 [Smittium culicis]|uniref:Lipase 2 n=1 Tax=Smittium culicis TaxID=133412 RepID=A0A1R1Y9E5_9FUNG|nr:Lipase 2 [Smittium culicis]
MRFFRKNIKLKGRLFTVTKKKYPLAKFSGSCFFFSSISKIDQPALDPNLLTTRNNDSNGLNCTNSIHAVKDPTSFKKFKDSKSFMNPENKPNSLLESDLSRTQSKLKPILSQPQANCTGTADLNSLGQGPDIPIQIPGSAQTINNLNATLQKDPLKTQSQINGILFPVKPIYIAPRNQIMLCHGLYGFDYKGPSKIPFLQIHYWTGIAKALRDLGSKVHVGRVSSTGGIKKRAHDLHHQLKTKIEPTADKQAKVNLLAHSMGGLDSRYLITHIRPNVFKSNYKVSSLTTISTPHNGSPFMDWCRDYLGLGNLIDSDLGVVSEPIISTIEAANFKRDKQIATLVRSLLDTPINDHQNSLNQLMYNSTAPEFLSNSNEADSIYSKIEPDSTLAEDLKGVAVNDKRLGDFADLLKYVMAKCNFLNVKDASDSNNKMHLHSYTDSLSFSDISAKNSGVTGWGVTGGSHLGQIIVLLRQLFNRLMYLLDQPAYYCLTTNYCTNIFNPRTPQMPDVSYYSYGAKINVDKGCNITSPLYFPHSIVYKAEGDNDGLVSLKSAQYGEYIETLECDHYELTNKNRVSSFLRFFLRPLINNQKKPDGSSTNLDNQTAGGDGRIEFGFEPGNTMYNSGNKKPSEEFDAIEFYLRAATRLYNQGH